MSFTVDVTQITHNLNAELQYSLDAAQEVARKIAYATEAKLHQVTPRHSGKAGDSWHTIQIGQDTFLVESDVPYMNELNHGSSSQAPAGFIENAVDSVARTLT
jgi:hypothetical protein